MGQLVVWTSLTGYKNLNRNKQFFAYSKSSDINNIQITVPLSAVCTFEDTPLDGVEFICFQKDLWLK